MCILGKEKVICQGERAICTLNMVSGKLEKVKGDVHRERKKILRESSPVSFVRGKKYLGREKEVSGNRKMEPWQERMKEV